MGPPDLGQIAGGALDGVDLGQIARGALDGAMGAGVANAWVQRGAAAAREQLGGGGSSGSSGSSGGGGATAAPSDPFQAIKDLYHKQLDDRLDTIRQQYQPLVKGLNRTSRQSNRQIRRSGRATRRQMEAEGGATNQRIAAAEGRIDPVDESTMTPEQQAALGDIREHQAGRVQQVSLEADRATRDAMNDSRLIQQAFRGQVATNRGDALLTIRTERAAARGAARDAYNDQINQLALGQAMGAAGGGGGGGGGSFRSSGSGGGSGFGPEEMSGYIFMSQDPNSKYYQMDPMSIAVHHKNGGLSGLNIPDPISASEANYAMQGELHALMVQMGFTPEQIAEQNLQNWTNSINYGSASPQDFINAAATPQQAAQIPGTTQSAQATWAQGLFG